MKKQSLTIGEVMAIKKMEVPPVDRDIYGLCAMLRRLADDLEKGNAVELDFDIDVESLKVFDYMKIKLETYHKRPDKAKTLKLKE